MKKWKKSIIRFRRYTEYLSSSSRALLALLSALWHNQLLRSNSTGSVISILTWLLICNHMSHDESLERLAIQHFDASALRRFGASTLERQTSIEHQHFENKCSWLQMAHVTLSNSWSLDTSVSDEVKKFFFFFISYGFCVVAKKQKRGQVLLAANGSSYTTEFSNWWYLGIILIQICFWNVSIFYGFRGATCRKIFPGERKKKK